ncbi:hypothetical protein LTR08_007275 [Meristemomyces frigidus]|nr:hypothetical protein LTR08_007275 [Meristemomyces frigidus]
MFTIIKAASGTGVRLGRLALPGRKPIATPHYLATTSRGVVPHLTQDTFVSATNINGVYVGLEDCKLDLRPCHPDALLTAAPFTNPNTNETVAVSTVVGFKSLPADDYANAVEKLQADVVIGIGDIPYGRALGHKRIEKATDRNIKWMQSHVALREGSSDSIKQARLFAPLLPVSCANQQFYVDSLVQDLAGDISGLAIYDLSSLMDLPETLRHLPRLGFTTPSTPQDILRHISLGIDVLTIPFVSTATDAGIALDFNFSALQQASAELELNAPIPLGIDMWQSTHAADLSPLVESCECYTCTNHHRAYVQHLLVAKELLGWVLLQIHNHHTIELLFTSIRRSLAVGTFTQDVERFGRVYESHLPEKSGQGPRVRGYQFKSNGPSEAKKNKSAFTKLDESLEKLAHSPLPRAHADAGQLEEQGFAEKTR